MHDNPLESGPRDDDRINVLVEDELADWGAHAGELRRALAAAS